jgi:Tol biopolymer transport system component
MYRSIGIALILAALALAAPAQAANSRIAFIRDDNVYTMKPDGSAVRQLTSRPADTGAAFDAWSPDGRQIAFDRFPPDAPAQIWVMNADGSGQHRLLADPSYDDFIPSFSPDGRFVVFARCGDVEGVGCAIHRVRVDGTHLTAITHFQREISDWAPTYSPDGRTIAFGSFARGGVIASTYLMDADGSHIRPLGIPPELQFLGGDWSPDGSRLASGSNCCNPQNGDVWTVKPNGKGLTQLMNTPDENDFGGTWSPNGDALVFERTNPELTDSDAYVMHADGSHMRLIQPHARYPNWSPGA